MRARTVRGLGGRRDLRCLFLRSKSSPEEPSEPGRDEGPRLTGAVRSVGGSSQRRQGPADHRGDRALQGLFQEDGAPGGAQRFLNPT